MVLSTIGKAGCCSASSRRTQSSVMMEPLFGKRPRFPSFHPCRSDRNPVDSSPWVRDVTTYFLEATAPKKLTPAGHVVLAFETIAGRVVTTILGERRPGYSKLGILGKFPHQKTQVFGIERNICVEIPDDIKIN